MKVTDLIQLVAVLTSLISAYITGPYALSGLVVVLVFIYVMRKKE
jgi:hypothetical protein